MSESKLVSRSEYLSFMDTGTSDSPAFNLMGEGFTSLSESKNPKEYSRQYINESTERTDVVGYAPSIAYSLDTYTNNPVIAKICKVTDEELRGTDAQVDIVSVNTYETASAGAYPAYKRRYAIIPDGKGDGTDALVYTGNFRAVGDVQPGTFDLSQKTFTPKSSV